MNDRTFADILLYMQISLVYIFILESFVDHPFVQQLQELDFKTADITAAMQVFKSKEGNT